MATDYDEARPDVAEASEKTLKDVQKMDAPTAKSVNAELDEADVSDGLELPGAIVDEELSVDVVPQGEDEFVCVECFDYPASEPGRGKNQDRCDLSGLRTRIRLTFHVATEFTQASVIRMSFT